MAKGKKADVTFMGEEFSKDKDYQNRWERKWNRHVYHHHYHDDDNGVMGAIFIFVGVVLLLNVTNLLPWGIWNQIANLWPILLILIGVGILFGKGYLGRFVSGVISFGVIIGLLFFILQTPFPHILDGVPQIVKDYVHLFWYLKK